MNQSNVAKLTFELDFQSETKSQPLTIEQLVLAWPTFFQVVVDSGDSGNKITECYNIARNVAYLFLLLSNTSINY